MIFDLVQGLIIGSLVLLSSLMVLRRMAPATSLKIQGRLAANLLKPGRSAPAHWLGKRLSARLDQAGGCGSDNGCGGCNGCGTSAAPSRQGQEIFRTRL
ncbi:DUF6587 family protein [Gallaecimonas xiamenensis]|uniref:Uncharacterized protein n=1 Tax=Gallaecimonas xiamenensis 3-C-1 TaxID=745411 RepID=K2JDN3_9GAMM|nr:DUF6587 family protein [Gallaecimonas xiamenensis]EKE68649.1 hypothetical protein B3C1_16511 [Gallaecimonas xiamenensis 3-C-1]